MADKEKLRILLVGMSPSIIRRVRLKGIPLATLALKAYVDKRISNEFPGLVDLQVKTFFVEEDTPDNIALQILEAKPDIVAFSVYIWNYCETMESASILKEKNEHITIICGGPQVSPIAMEVMSEHACVDIIPYITIPGEIIFYNLVKAFLMGKKLDAVEGIIYRGHGGSLVKTSLLTEKLDYSKVPSPYLNGPLSFMPDKFYVLSLEGSRGCPYDCGYCFNGRGANKINFFPLEKILSEIEVAYNNPNVKYVFFADSDILLDQKRAEVIISHILKQGSKVISEFTINILRMNKEIAKLLAQLPYYRFCFALQSVNPKALNCIGNLRPRPEDFVEKISTFKSWLPNVAFSIDVMLGLPGDDLAGFKATLDYCLSFKPERVALNYPVYLLPGSRFFEEKDTLGLHYSPSPHFCIIDTDIFPKQDIEIALRLALWLDVLTYFYPVIALFFHAICKDNSPGARINKLQEWISAIEKKLNLFDPGLDMVGIATSSVKDWNKLKGHVLRKASQAQSAHIIYRAILQQEELKHPDEAKKTISHGVNIFDYLSSKKISSIEFSDFDKLPASITQNHTSEEINSLFSIYRQ